MQIPFLFRCVRTFWNTEPTHIYDRHVDIIKELISRKPPSGAESDLKPGHYKFLRLYDKGYSHRKLRDL